MIYHLNGNQKEADKVFYWLKKANEYHDFGLIESKIEPLLDPFRKDAPMAMLFRKT